MALTPSFPYRRVFPAFSDPFRDFEVFRLVVIEHSELDFTEFKNAYPVILIPLKSLTCKPKRPAVFGNRPYYVFRDATGHFGFNFERDDYF